MNQKLKLITPSTIFRPQPYGGVRSSADMNLFMDGVKADILELVDMLNSQMIPILNGLPLGEYTENLSAVINGLTAASCYIDAVVADTDAYAEYYYYSGTPHRPSTVKEVTDRLIHNLADLKAVVDAISASLVDTAEPTDLTALMDELKDIRNSISEILTVLRSLKFYSNEMRIQAITVLADPDVIKAPVQTLIGLAPAVRFLSTVNQNMYINFTVPLQMDVSQPITTYITYCMDTSEAGSKVKLDLSYQVVRAGDNLETATTTTKSVVLTPTDTAEDVNVYTGSGLTITTLQAYDMVNIRLTRDINTSPNHSGNFHLADISFFAKIKEVPQISI